MIKKYSGCAAAILMLIGILQGQNLYVSSTGDNAGNSVLKYNASTGAFISTFMPAVFMKPIGRLTVAERDREAGPMSSVKDGQKILGNVSVGRGCLVTFS